MRMGLSSRAQFGSVVFVFVLVGFMLGAVFGPHDPFDQVLLAGGVIGVALVVGYVIAYKTSRPC